MHFFLTFWQLKKYFWCFFINKSSYPLAVSCSLIVLKSHLRSIYNSCEFSLLACLIVYPDSPASCFLFVLLLTVHLSSLSWQINLASSFLKFWILVNFISGIYSPETFVYLIWPLCLPHWIQRAFILVSFFVHLISNQPGILNLILITHSVFFKIFSCLI